MNRILTVSSVALLALCVSSCDFFRAVAGRPTSAELSDTTSCCAVDSAACCPSDSTCAMEDSCACEACDTLTLADSLSAKVDSLVAVADSSVCAKVDSLKAVADSLAGVECEKASTIVDDSAIEEKIIKNLHKTGFVRTEISYNDVDLVSAVEPGYYILVGTFAKQENAARVAKSARKAGLDVTMIEYANGRTAVGVCHTDDVVDAFKALGEVRKKSFCPKDACILVAE